MILFQRKVWKKVQFVDWIAINFVDATVPDITNNIWTNTFYTRQFAEQFVEIDYLCWQPYTLFSVWSIFYII